MGDCAAHVRQDEQSFDCCVLHGLASTRLIACSILDELKASLPDDLPPLESTNHLLPLDLPAQLCFYDGGPKKAFVESTSEQPIIRANRQHLRELLGTGIDVQWSKSIVRIEQDTQSVRISFEDGSTAVGDVLVGADGANSFGECFFR